MCVGVPCLWVRIADEPEHDLQSDHNVYVVCTVCVVVALHEPVDAQLNRDKQLAQCVKTHAQTWKQSRARLPRPF